MKKPTKTEELRKLLHETQDIHRADILKTLGRLGKLEAEVKLLRLDSVDRVELQVVQDRLERLESRLPDLMVKFVLLAVWVLLGSLLVSLVASQLNNRSKYENQRPSSSKPDQVGYAFNADNPTSPNRGLGEGATPTKPRDTEPKRGLDSGR